jgi:NADH-quinone oxidoreductase subunit J
VLALLVAQNIAFYVIAALMVLGAVRVVTSRNIMHAALWLVLVLSGVAAQYVLLAAEFVAVTQVLVYLGAVMVLFLFGIMLTRASGSAEEQMDNPRPAKLAAAGIGVVLLGVLTYSLWDGFGDREFGDIAVQRTAQVSDSIFTSFVIPFLLISVLLLVALVGAIVLARRD